MRIGPHQSSYRLEACNIDKYFFPKYYGFIDVYTLTVLKFLFLFRMAVDEPRMLFFYLRTVIMGS